MQQGETAAIPATKDNSVASSDELQRCRDGLTMPDRYNLPKSGKFLLIRGETSYVLVGKAGSPISLCIEAPDGEVCQGLTDDDIIAVSAPEGGPVEPAVMLLESGTAVPVPSRGAAEGPPGFRPFALRRVCRRDDQPGLLGEAGNPPRTGHTLRRSGIFRSGSACHYRRHTNHRDNRELFGMPRVI